MKTRISQRFSPSYELLSKYRDILMGLSILLIIIFHFTEDRQGDNYGFFGLTEWYKTYIGSSSVDAFLLLSGLGLYYSRRKRPDLPLQTFYSKRFSRILIPYALIAVPTFLYFDLTVRGTGLLGVVQDVSFYSFFTEGQARYWYILAASLCYLAFPYFYELIHRAEDRYTAQMRVLAFFLLVTVVVHLLKDYNKAFYGHTEILLLRLPVFVFGIYLGKLSFQKVKMGPEVAALLLLACPLFQGVGLETSILRRYLAAMINIALCFVVVVVLEYACHPRVLKGIRAVFGWMGAYSLELYLSHVTVRAILNANQIKTSRVRNELLMLAIAVPLAVLLKLVTERIVHAKTQKTAQ